MRYAPTKIVNAGDMSDDIVSTIVPLDQVFGYSVQADYATAGTLGGTLALQASNDHRIDNNGNVTNAGNFVTITDTPVVLTGAGSFIWNVTSSNYLFMRLIYTADPSDTGTLNAYITTKGV